jgi:hypothetical protein
MFPAPDFANRASFASMSDCTAGGSLRSWRRASCVHVIAFTIAIYQPEGMVEIVPVLDRCL